MKIGVIGGSGLYNLDGVAKVEEHRIETPFGMPSDVYVETSLGGVEVVFLPRHGRGHRLLPAEINHRANIYGFKMMGVERIVAVTAVGSLKEELAPRDIVLPDQYFDRTKGSLGHSFFGEGIVAHVPFGDPCCGELRGLIAATVRNVLKKQAGSSTTKLIEKGTYVNMEGPLFSTKAESNVYRSFGFDVIGMTSLPEAKLCREAEICYQNLSMVTDYDCWREAGESVSVEMVMGHFSANISMVKAVLKDLLPTLSLARTCGCGDALLGAIMTDHSVIPVETKKKLRPIIGKYLRD